MVYYPPDKVDFTHNGKSLSLPQLIARFMPKLQFRLFFPEFLFHGLNRVPISARNPKMHGFTLTNFVTYGHQAPEFRPG